MTTNDRALAPHITEFLDRCCETMAPGSVRSYRRDLRLLCLCLADVTARSNPNGGRADITTLRLDDLTTENLDAALSLFAAGAFRRHGTDTPRAPRTVARATSSLEMLCTDLCRRRLLAGNPLSGLPRTRTPERIHARLSGPQIQELLAAAASAPPPQLRIRWPARDVALLTTFLALGLRLNELLALTVGDITGDTDAPVLHIGADSRYARHRPIPPGLAHRFADYLNDRRLNLREAHPRKTARHVLPLAGMDTAAASAFDARTPLFVTTHGTAPVRNYIHRLVQRIFEHAELPASTYSANGKVQILRATAARIYKDNGAGFEELHTLMGNFSWDATRDGVYDDPAGPYNVYSHHHEHRTVPPPATDAAAAAATTGATSRHVATSRRTSMTQHDPHPPHDTTPRSRNDTTRPARRAPTLRFGVAGMRRIAAGTKTATVVVTRSRRLRTGTIVLARTAHGGALASIPLTITAAYPVAHLHDIPHTAHRHNLALSDFVDQKTWDEYLHSLGATDAETPAVIITVRTAGPLSGAPLESVAKQRGRSKSGRRWQIITDSTPITPATPVHPGDLRELRHRLDNAIHRAARGDTPPPGLPATINALAGAGRCAGTLSAPQQHRHGIDAADAANATAWLTAHQITTTTPPGHVLAARILRGLRALAPATTRDDSTTSVPQPTHSPPDRQPSSSRSRHAETPPTTTPHTKDQRQ